MRHAEFFASFAEEADPYLRHGPDQQQWSDRMAADFDNVRAAIAYGLDHAPELALRLIGSLSFFVWLRGGFRETAGWVDAALALADGLDRRLVGKVHECGAVVFERLGDNEAATRHAEAAYAAGLEGGDEFAMANALRERGKAAVARGDLDGARENLTQLAELAERIGDRWNGAIALNNLGDLALQVGDWDQVIELCRRSSVLRRESGDRWGAALALTNVASAELERGRPEAAASVLAEALQESLEVGATMVVGACLVCFTSVLFALGREREAAQLYGFSEYLREELASVRDGFEQGVFERTTASLRAVLGDDAFAAEADRGRELSIAEAAALAQSRAAVSP
jgi:tetratricopeptide (TPR) repeat protein